MRSRSRTWIRITRTLDAQKANVQAASANVSRLEQLQGFEKVIAPFDGIITQRLTDIGDLINAGNGGTGHELFRIAKINVIRAFVTVPETYSEQIVDRHEGNACRSPDLPISNSLEQ